MSGVLQLPRSIWESMTLKQLITMHDAYLIDRWWHTAFISSYLHNLQAMIANALNRKGRKAQPKSPSEMHPYVQSRTTGTRITPKTIGILKAMGNALCKK